MCPIDCFMLCGSAFANDLNGAFGQWVVQGAVDVDIGANPSAEGGGEDEGVDDQAVKVVDIVDTFRLQVCDSHHFIFI